MFFFEYAFAFKRKSTQKLTDLPEVKEKFSFPLLRKRTAGAQFVYRQKKTHIFSKFPMQTEWREPFEYPIGISYVQALENCLIKRDSVLIEVTKSKVRISFFVIAVVLQKNVRKLSFSFAK